VRLIYTPEDGEKREFSFRPPKLMSPEVEALEDVGGDAWDSFDEFAVKFLKGNRRAYRAALWLMLKREEPALKFRDLVVRVDEVSVEFDDDEAQKVRQAIVDEPELDADERESLLAVMDRSITDRMDAGLDVPKDSPTGEGSTDSA
jgi:hypothetical protein